jgi:hypothetical protein
MTTTTYKFKAKLGDSLFEILLSPGKTKEDVEVGVLSAIGREKKVKHLSKTEYKTSLKGKNCIIVLKKVISGDSFVIVRG